MNYEPRSERDEMHPDAEADAEALEAERRAVLKEQRDDDDGPTPDQLSCGCCTNGCCCWNHQNRPMGIMPRTCTYHAKRAKGGAQ